MSPVVKTVAAKAGLVPVIALALVLAACPNNQPPIDDCDCPQGERCEGEVCVLTCESPQAVCDENATCTDTAQSYGCECNEGYHGDGLTCTAVQVCDDGTTICDGNATCIATAGSYECECNEGFRGDGFQCTDVDECAEGTAECDANADCENSPGSYSCTCRSGFDGPGTSCSDIDECTAGTDNCDANADCQNTVGSFSCTCTSGFTGSGTSCVDIDECCADTDNCHPWAHCVNAEGTFSCSCSLGYVGDGISSCAPRFTDVPAGHPAIRPAGWMAREGITLGCNPPANTQYCPNTILKRDAAATFLARALNLPAASTDYFTDDNGNLHEAAINAVRQAGIILGCNPPANTQYCPHNDLLRGQWAIFVSNGYGVAATSNDFYTDDTGHYAQTSINRLANAGAARGCGGTAYCPDQPVTRADAAGLLFRTEGPTITPWPLLFSDEFNSAAGTPPDPTHWTHQIGTGSGAAGWGNNELQYYTADAANSACDGAGNLVITAREHTGSLSCYYGPCLYTSARLMSLGTVQPQYGRIEARVRLPRGEGLWPAFWGLGTDHATVGWPHSGEIDIMEFVGRLPTQVFATIHGPGYSGGNGWGDVYSTAPAEITDEFHIFAVEWEPDEIRWYFDEINIHNATPSDVAPDVWVFNDPLYLIMNLAVGGTLGGNVPAATAFPQQMKIDYVRIYGGCGP